MDDENIGKRLQTLGKRLRKGLSLRHRLSAKLQDAAHNAVIEQYAQETGKSLEESQAQLERERVEMDRQRQRERQRRHGTKPDPHRKQK